MDTTKSYIKIFDITQENAEDFEFDFNTYDSDLLTELVPDQGDWGSLTWGIELEEYEYNTRDQIIFLTLDTKWEPPIKWLKNASIGTHYFENNAGAVINTAISIYSHGVMRVRDDSKIKISSLDLDATLTANSLEDALIQEGPFGLVQSLMHVVQPKYGFELCLTGCGSMGSAR